MLKRYSQMWQMYFIKLLDNVPLLIPRDKPSKSINREMRKQRAILAHMIGLAAETVMYYKAY